MTTQANPPSEPRPSATVILVREAKGGGDLEIYLVCRHRKASFMASAFVFPGGVAEPQDGDDLRVTAVRELREECGVQLAPDALHFFSHWITPSVEPRRYSAYFYVAALPAGQTPAYDNHETVDEAWVTPDQALARAGELRLPPPQLRTFFDLQAPSRQGMSAVLAACVARAAAPHPILPRGFSDDGRITLLLPWDPDYERLGTGAKLLLPPGHPLATGPSRFVLDGTTWIHTTPGS